MPNEQAPQAAVERVARAICKAWLMKEAGKMFGRGEIPAFQAAAMAAATLRGVDSHWRDFIVEAEAAIAAMHPSAHGE